MKVATLLGVLLLLVVSGSRNGGGELTIEQRIDRARRTFEAKRDFCMATYPRRFVAVGVDATGRTTWAICEAEEGSWLDAYEELNRQLPTVEGSVFVSTWPPREPQ